MLLVRLGRGERLAEESVNLVVPGHRGHGGLGRDVGVQTAVHIRRVCLQMGREVFELAR